MMVELGLVERAEWATLVRGVCAPHENGTGCDDGSLAKHVGAQPARGSDSGWMLVCTLTFQEFLKKINFKN